MVPLRRELATSDELTELLRDLSPAESCMYRGVAFDTYYQRFKAFLPLALGAVGMRLALEHEPGDYVRVWLPTPLGIDLFLHTLSEAQPDKDGLDAYFSIGAIDLDLARESLSGPFTTVLLALAKAYNLVEMGCDADRNEYIEFGPLKRRPEEIAADLTAVIEGVTELRSPLVPCEVLSDNPFND